MGFQEPCVNWSEVKSTCSLADLLQIGAEDIRASAAHNRLEENRTGVKQRGRVATLLHNQLAGFTRGKGVDHTGLVRWAWTMVEGQPGHQTTFISAYAPCSNKSSGLTTVYQQHLRFIQKNSLKTNPKLMFHDDLIDFIKSRR